MNPDGSWGQCVHPADPCTTVPESHLLSKPPSDVLLSVTTAAIRLEAELTDAALLMFDKLMGGLSRRAEGRASDNAAGAFA